MTVINPNSISGITSITLPAGDDNVLTIHTNDGVERFRIDSSGNVKVGSAATISPDGDLFVTGVTTATTFTGAHSGSGANLTSLPAAQLTGSLPAISGANLTGIAATDNVRTGILDVAGIATFRSDVNVPNINGGQIGGRRNLIINGAMQVAQRGTSYSGNNYNTVDRIRPMNGGGAVTQAQVDISSSDTPYTLGFRKALKVTNSTAAAEVDDYRDIRYYVEAQDIANSGFNLDSASSKITFSFWAKSSVAMTYYYFIYVPDSSKHYAASFALSANTWTKVTKTIPGASGLSVNNDNGNGFNIQIAMHWGSDYTTSGQALDTWGTWSGSSRVPDMVSTWASTTNATFEITGLQLEVGSQATAFEHRSFGEELALCQRYYETNDPLTTAKNTNGSISSQWAYMGANDGQTLLLSTGVVYKVVKRANPTVTLYNPSDTSTANRADVQGVERTVTAVYGSATAATRIYVTGGSTGNYVTFNWEAESEL